MNQIPDILLGKYLSLKDFCTCTNTYKKYSFDIDPIPKNSETISALKALNQFIIDPIIDKYSLEKFVLTYGFCSPDLKRYLNKKDPVTGIKNGRIEPRIDQHMAHEINKNGEYYCKRLGAACDFIILGIKSQIVIEWIVSEKLPFDSIYFYGENRPIHISYGQQHKRDIWGFNSTGQPIKMNKTFKIAN